jgi:probable rRNA maturation factor
MKLNSRKNNNDSIREGETKMDLFIDNRQDLISIDERIENLVMRIAEVCLKMEEFDPDWEVSVSFVTNDEIRELNSQYRGKNEPTDVLSFPMDDEFGLEEKLLGDIVISTQKVIEQAEEFGHSLDREIAYLTVHSMFHLMGYDHIDLQDKVIMRSREKEAMKILGIFKHQEEQS